MNTRRRWLTAGATLPTLAWLGALRAQPNAPVVIGLLSAHERQAHVALVEAMAALGWKLGVHYRLEARYAEGFVDRLPALAQELAALKPAPAFDNAGISAFPGGMSENTPFGTKDQVGLNFSEFAWNNNSMAGDASGRDDTGYLWSDYVRLPTTTVDNQLKLIDPMHYIDSRADTAPYWYVRHGTRDRDTSFTVSVNLARALASDRDVRDLNYRLAWDQPHAGNYDVPEAMQWIAASLQAASGKRK